MKSELILNKNGKRVKFQKASGKRKARGKEYYKKELNKEQKEHIRSVFNLFETDRSGG